MLASTALLFVGNGLQMTLSPVRGQATGTSAGVLGVLGSIYFSWFIAGCLIGPAIVARAGQIRCFAAMEVVASRVDLRHALAIAPVPWWIMRGGTGRCLPCPIWSPKAG